MIKTILVATAAEQADLATMTAASRVAREFAGHLEVLHVRLDPVDVAVAMSTEASGGMLLESVIEQLERVASEREAAGKRLFDEFCAREKLAVVDAPGDQWRDKATAQWHVETGDWVRWMTRCGMAADIIVAGRGADHDVTARSVLEAALLETGRPLLIPTASETAPAAVDGTVAIAWKATPQAARAVAAAMPFIARAKEVVVMTVEEAEGSGDVERLVRNLAWHGCRVRAESLASDGGDAAEILLAAAQERAGLLVMGGYGHSRVREWVFGGFTRRVLADAPLSVLMAH